MGKLFQSVVGKKCTNAQGPEACKRFGQSADVHLTLCEECGLPLQEVTVTNQRMVLLGSLMVFLIVSGGGYMTTLFLKQYLVRQASERLSRASSVLTEKLKSTSSRELESLLAQLRSEFQLDDGGLRKLRSQASELIAGLPATLTPSQTSEFKRLLRNVYADGNKSSAEENELQRFLSENSKDPVQYAAIQRDLESQIQEAASRSKQANGYARQGKFDKAVQEFQEASKLDPESAMSWANLGGALANAGKLEEARGAYDKALRLDQNNWLAHYNLGTLYARQKNNEMAIGELVLAVQLLGTQPDGPSSKAVALRDLKENSLFEDLRNDPRIQKLVARQ